MDSKAGNKTLRLLVWVVIALVIAIPIVLALMSPLLAWRSPVYIIAGFAGVITLGMLFLQPLLIGGYLPNVSKPVARQVHRWVGTMLVCAVIVHVGGLWLTSPPDVIDALTFSSPTPFSNWGVVAMWALFATAILAMFRKRLQLRPRNWKLAHSILALVIIICTVVHAILIEGTMETISKVVICALIIVVSLKVLFSQKLWFDFRIGTKKKSST